MRHWLSRNAVPIGLVILASAAVIGLFEVLDALTNSNQVAGGEATEMEGLASVAGLIKVLIFLSVGALIAMPIRRRVQGQKQ